MVFGGHSLYISESTLPIMGPHPHDHIQPWERYPQGPGGPEEELLLALLVAQLNQRFMDWTLSGTILDQSVAHPPCHYDRGYSMVRMGNMKLKEVK